MTDHANRLWELLGELEARPEGLSEATTIMEGLSDPPVRLSPLFEWKGWNIDDEAALAILRDAARRVCDRAGIILENDGGSPVYEARSKYHGLKNYIVRPSGDDLEYEPTLIRCLEWIIKQRNP
jgi:hypothetical protein